MTHPTTEQLNDPRWWEENAPSWARSYGRAGDQRVPVWFNMRQYQHAEGVQAHVVFAFSDACTFGLEEIECIASRPDEPERLNGRPIPVNLEAPQSYDGKGQHNPNRDHSTVVEGDPEYHPSPGTEAMATWLEPPDGGDRRPERVLVKGYYESSLKHLDQVWFTTQEGEDLVHLTENVLFEPLDTRIADTLAEIISEIEVRFTGAHFELFPGPVVDELLSRFDVSFKE